MKASIGKVVPQHFPGIYSDYKNFVSRYSLYETFEKIDALTEK